MTRLLADREAPAIFPYGGFGSLLVGGEPSRDGKTFFARRILAFSPNLKRRRFHISLRKCDFYDDRALCRDARRKLEFWLDPVALQTHWDRTWNQWKHLLGSKIEVEGTFVQCGKYRKRGQEWELVTWETALPSRLNVKLPSDFPHSWRRRKPPIIALVSTRGRWIRSGCFWNTGRSSARTATNLRRAATSRRLRCRTNQLASGLRSILLSPARRRARRIYLFRHEYIFDVEKAVVVETPQLGHATYVFAKPRSMDSFLALYTRPQRMTSAKTVTTQGNVWGSWDA